jgi:hypothetical protein
MESATTLQLVRESKIRDLLPSDLATDRLEASGVLVKDNYYYVVFDNRAEIARLAHSLQADEANGLFGMDDAEHGYEGIAFNEAKQRFYLLVEARKRKGGGYEAEVYEYNDQFQHVKDRRLDFALASENKGFEAIAHARRGGEDFVLALCEGNKCKSGKAGRKPGGGRVQLFEKKKKRWAHRQTVKLPKSVRFVDYSGMSIDNGRVAIVSQENSMLWIGQFHETDWAWRDEGRLYAFPRTETGAILYGNVEGVAWISPTRIVTVSDRRKSEHRGTEMEEKDQSIHIFDLPE